MSNIINFTSRVKPNQSGLDLVDGKALYEIYRQERTRQGFEEWKWESLMITQHLVWQRLAERIGWQP